MELKITWKHVVKVWWAYYWRAVIIMILAFILNAMARFCIGFIGDLVGAPPGFVTFLCYLVTIICPLALSLLPMKWILGKDFGSFRLVLLAKEATDSDPSLGALNQSKSVAALVSPIKPSRMAWQQPCPVWNRLYLLDIQPASIAAGSRPRREATHPAFFRLCDRFFCINTIHALTTAQ